MKVDVVGEDARVETQLNDNAENAGFALLAHDVRSSLFGLLGSLELIDDASLPEDTRERLKRARASGAMLSDLLGLVFGGVDVAEDKAPLDVRDELELMAQRWQDPAEEAGVRVQIAMPETAPKINVIDRVGFHRVFNNLIGNAVKFGQNGTVTVSVEDTGDSITFAIRDNGPGFSEDSLKMLFEFRGRPEDSPKEGSGLGLYISKKLVTEAGGQISVQNHEDGGAYITVTFPTSDADAPPSLPATGDGLPDLSHLNLLLAEDNLTNQLVVTQMLASMGAKFTVASDGVEALELFERDDFDAVLLDIEMPRKSGLEVLREIRARDDQKSATPLIALTAYVMQEHREKINAAGADGLIAKPIAGIAPLGQMILEYVHGMATPQNYAKPAVSERDTGFIDREIYDQITKTIGPDFLGEFLEKVVLDLNSIGEGLKAAEEAGNFAEMRSHSHILISVAGAIGATNLQSLAQELNTAARSGVAQKTRPLNLVCQEGILTVVSFLLNETES